MKRFKLLYLFPLLIVVVELSEGAPFMGAHHGGVDGRVVRVELHNHSFVTATYRVGGKEYTLVRSGDITRYEVGDTIRIFYRSDRPDIATYAEDDFSYGTAVGIVVFCLVLEGVMLFVVKFLELGAAEEKR